MNVKEEYLKLQEIKDCIFRVLSLVYLANCNFKRLKHLVLYEKNITMLNMGTNRVSFIDTGISVTIYVLQDSTKCTLQINDLFMTINKERRG